MALASMEPSIESAAPTNMKPPRDARCGINATECSTRASHGVQITHRSAAITSMSISSTTSATKAMSTATSIRRACEHDAPAQPTLQQAIASCTIEDDDNGKPSTAQVPPRASASICQTFLERYIAATSSKMYEVEELIDYYFHRRLAAITAVVISALPIVITPNQITLFGLVFGWGAAACVYDSEFHTLLGWEPQTALGVGAVLMFCWIVSDCADGQVARLCKRGTRTGRLLDGLVDIFVMIPNCAVLGLVVAHRLGQEYMVLATIAGISLWLHCITYDKIKNTYLENTLPQSECDGESVESVMAEYRESFARNPISLDTILFAIYVMYLTAQAIVTSDVASMTTASRKRIDGKADEQYRRAYAQKYAHVVRYASWMGLSAHVTGLYVGYFAAMFDFFALYYTMLYFSIVLNVVLVVTWAAYIKSGMGSHTKASMTAQ